MLKAMHEDGLIGSYFDYWRLPEPVVAAWSLWADERSSALERERKQRERESRREAAKRR